MTSPLSEIQLPVAHWYDASLDRPGWSCTYVPAGGSLRACPDLASQFKKIAQAWMAVSNPSGELPHVSASPVIAILRKLIQRGTTPPIDPASEERLIELVGLESQLLPAPFEGDISYRLNPSVQIDVEPESFLRSAIQIDTTVQFDSPIESMFMTQWVPTQLSSEAQRWFIPQASLDALLQQTGMEAIADRRVDFLLAPPWLKPLVVELDAEDHDAAIDADRDRSLANAGYPVLRIPNEEVSVGHGPGLSQLRAYWESPPTTRDDQWITLLFGPTQVHRLALSLIEAMARGYLGEDRWVIQVMDDLEVAVDLFAPAYLDLFAALDSIWANGLMPREIHLLSSEDHSYVRRGVGYEPAPPRSGLQPDVVFRLEALKSPLDPLEPTGDVPEIVVRSAYLPVSVAPAIQDEPEAVFPTDGSDLLRPLTVVLRAIFAKERFREGQYEALRQVLSRRDCAVLLPTGAGKSLIYQLAGLVLPGRTLIVDPIVALMEDQVERLVFQGIDRVSTISAMHARQGLGDQVLQQIASGGALFIFVTPERLQQQAFRQGLRQLAFLSHVNLAVIDEAHCVSEWGHDFRPSYLNLASVLRTTCSDRLGRPPPLLALTGTASRSVLRDVLIELRIDASDEHSIVRPQTFDRRELEFDVHRTSSSESSAALLGLLRTLPTRFRLSAGDFYRTRGEETTCGIVFCPHVNGEFGIAEVALSTRHAIGSPPVMYAGTPPRGYDRDSWDVTKRKNARSFKANESVVMVATKAFGMGIDKPNIRWTIHYGIPGSIEGYYQEAGRAGRDGKRSVCLLLLNEFNEARARQLLDDSIVIDQARSNYESLRARATDDDVTRQLFFLFNNFPGPQYETQMLIALLDEIGELGRARVVRIPMGPQDKRGERERAIYRLVVLGVLGDYTVDWGGSTFDLELADANASSVVASLVRYIERSAPSRATVVGQDLGSRSFAEPRDAIEVCAEALVDYVYETIAGSRRRSLREMWLAARESVVESNVALRQRILDYLTQGFLATVLERLLERPRYRFQEWREELEQVGAGPDSLELRGTSARLLASNPDHPGLLFSRGISEVLVEQGDLNEFASNLELSIEAAIERYEAAEDAEEMLAWAVEACRARSGPAIAVPVAVARRRGVSVEDVAKYERQGLQPDEPDLDLSVLGLASALERLVGVVRTNAGEWEGTGG